MKIDLLEILRCPFCGSSLELSETTKIDRQDDQIINGILSCQCSAYPVVDRIPVFSADYLADQAREHLAAEEPQEALLTMLGLDESSRQRAFISFLAQGSSATYKDGVQILCPDAEGTYFIYRFTDPTYLIGQKLLQAVGSNERCFAKRAIDLCGGSGHLTRVLCEVAGPAEVLLADAYYWKLWMAKRFNAPRCQPVCCDANNPLPFVHDAFSLAFCSDAFHYIWSKRLLASEMMRLVGHRGVVLLSHLHNAMVENFSAGMPLASKWWQNLFGEMKARVFKESEVFESCLNRSFLDLTRVYRDEELADEQALFLMASGEEDVFRTYSHSDSTICGGQIYLNPLYHIEQREGSVALRLHFPSPEYEEEFGASKRYLPERVEMTMEDFRLSQLWAQSWAQSGTLNDNIRKLLEQRVLLELPKGYL